MFPAMILDIYLLFEMCFYSFDHFSQQEEIDAIVSEHNRLRRLVAKGEETRGLDGVAQPGATNMHKLEWDVELAELAQE